MIKSAPAKTAHSMITSSLASRQMPLRCPGVSTWINPLENSASTASNRSSDQLNLSVKTSRTSPRICSQVDNLCSSNARCSALNGVPPNWNADIQMQESTTQFKRSSSAWQISLPSSHEQAVLRHLRCMGQNHEKRLLLARPRACGEFSARGTPGTPRETVR